MKWFWKSREKRAPLEFEDAVCFNWALDTNRELQEGLLKLAEQYPHLTEERYTQRLLELFQSPQELCGGGSFRGSSRTPTPTP